MNNNAKENAKRRFRFNFIDALLLIVIIAVAALLVYIFTSDDGFGTVDTVTIEYQVLISGIRDEFKDLVQIGDKVIDSVGLFEIGEITDVKYSQYMYAVNDEVNGVTVMTEYPEHSEMEVHIRAEASVEDGLYYINGYKIAVGTLVSMRTPNFVEQGYCTVITEADGNGEE